MGWMNPIYGKLRQALASRMYRNGNEQRLLMLNLEGQDYNYERGNEPMVRALRSAADRLAG